MDEDTKKLLEAWGLPQYIETFELNRINIECLGMLDGNLVRDIIQPIGDRAIFLTNLENWKSVVEKRETTLVQVQATTSSNSPIIYEFVDMLNDSHKAAEPNIEEPTLNPSSSPIESPPSPVPARTSSPSLSESSIQSSHTVPLLELLNSSAEGRAIVNLHKEEGLLSSCSRRKISNLIIKHLLNDDPEKRILSATLLEYAQQIKLLFPKENLSTYFIPYVNNTQLKIKRCAKGKLYDCLQNRRRDYREAKLINKKRNVPTTSTESKNSTDLNCNEDDINFLKVSSEPWELVEEKWALTVQSRLDMLNKNEMNANDYMSLFPALKKSTGFHLLLQDFKHLYPNYFNKLNEQFPLQKDKLVKVILKKHNRNPDLQENIQKYIELNENINNAKSQEATNIIAFMLLALTLAPPSSKTKKKTDWRPSKIESKEGFITHIARPMDLLETINRRREKFRTLGVTLQPFVIIVGSDVTDIQAYYIIINDTLYIVHSILEAVDACFKCFFSLHCQYPQECVGVWTFIQRAFFNIKTPWDKEFVAVNTLISDLS